MAIKQSCPASTPPPLYWSSSRPAPREVLSRYAALRSVDTATKSQPRLESDMLSAYHRASPLNLLSRCSPSAIREGYLHRWGGNISFLQRAIEDLEQLGMQVDGGIGSYGYFGSSSRHHTSSRGPKSCCLIHPYLSTRLFAFIHTTMLEAHLT